MKMTDVSAISPEVWAAARAAEDEASAGERRMLRRTAFALLALAALATAVALSGLAGSRVESSGWNSAAMDGRTVRLEIGVLNDGFVPTDLVRAESTYPGLQITQTSFSAPRLAPGQEATVVITYLVTDCAQAMAAEDGSSALADVAALTTRAFLREQRTMLTNLSPSGLHDLVVLSCDPERVAQ